MDFVYVVKISGTTGTRIDLPIAHHPVNMHIQTELQVDDLRIDRVRAPTKIDRPISDILTDSKVPRIPRCLTEPAV